MSGNPKTHKRILIVEDDGITAARIEDLLADRGYTATSVASGEEAISLATSSAPDLALMDVHLSREMDGITAAEEIRAVRDIPVVFLTAFSDDSLLRRARSTAPHGYLIKPVRDRELLATLEMALYKHETDRRVQAEQERMTAQRRERIERRQYGRKMESLGIMAGAMAHHFNNLLAVILGHTEMIQSDPATPASLQSPLAEISHAGRRAGEIIEQILMYRGKFPAVPSAVDLSDLVREMWPMVKLAAGRRRRLLRNLDDALPKTMLDPDRIRQVVVSLVANAAEATTEGEGTVTVSTGSLHADAAYFSEPFQNDAVQAGRYVCLSVTDTGEGMDEGTREKMFDPFFTTRFQGRGLGLSAVLGIVRAHGGAVKVFSRPDSGTTIQVLFPAAA